MPLGPERFARHRHHVRLMQQPLRQLHRRRYPRLPQIPRHIRINVERALRLRARDPRNLPQPRQNPIPQLQVIRPHLAHAFLRPAQRRNRCLLHERRRARRRLALQLRHRRNHRLRPQRESRAPSRHRIRLRQRPQHYHVLLRIRKRSSAHQRTRVLQIHIAFVEQHPDPALVRQMHDPLQILRRHHRTRRIRRRIQNDRLRLRRDRPLDRICRDAETLRFRRLHEYARPACVLHDVLVRHPVRHRHNHLIAVIHQHLDGIEDRQLSARREDRLVRRVARPKIRAVALHNRLAHLRNPGNHGVL